ncbi:MAG TPA: ChuX/HutX family heme-like substrate-binding protein [Reyranella sp.]|nr:ChuX/HutX family heme-like substrate-binding protein [Reyranella sp.]
MLSSANADLAARWSRLRGEQPTLRIRDAATTLGVSEAELVALCIGNGGIGTTATPLAADWRSILSEMPQVGRVMCLTRNEHCVHERHGRFEDVQVTGPHGLVLGPDIDLRLFLGSWKHGFAVREPIKQGERLSLQFFDGAGEAVHKIYATDETDRAAFDALITRHRAEAPGALSVAPRAPDTVDRPDSEIDVEGLRQAWRAMKDTHEFFGMLGKFKVGRVQALRLVGEEFARELPPRALRSAMEAASADGTPIMIFVGSGGCIQIHSGPINRLVEVHGWFNVLDPAFNLHLREAGVARVFSVRKPTEDGVVTSIEAFCNRDRNILLMFGARKPGKPELEPWRSIVARIEKQAAS